VWIVQFFYWLAISFASLAWWCSCFPCFVLLLLLLCSFSSSSFLSRLLYPNCINCLVLLPFAFVCHGFGFLFAPLLCYVAFRLAWSHLSPIISHYCYSTSRIKLPSTWGHISSIWKLDPFFELREWVVDKWLIYGIEPRVSKNPSNGCDRCGNLCSSKKRKPCLCT